MTKVEKCAHQSCVCIVHEGGEFGDYCSAHCQEAKDLTELRCECGHDACMADAEGRSPAGTVRREVGGRT